MKEYFGRDDVIRSTMQISFIIREKYDFFQLGDNPMKKNCPIVKSYLEFNI
jgi:hypothetical protein